MQENSWAPVSIPDPGGPPRFAPRQIWHYAATQWRRVFGLNVTQIDDLLFVGGQFSTAQWPRLHARGVRAVLNLQVEREDSFQPPLPDRTLRLPVEDYQPPTIEQLHAAVAFIRSAHADRLPVMVHCHAGVGRASLTASAYLMTGGLGHIEAFSRIRRARPIVALTAGQLARLVEWESVTKGGV